MRGFWREVVLKNAAKKWKEGRNYDNFNSTNCIVTLYCRWFLSAVCWKMPFISSAWKYKRRASQPFCKSGFFLFFYLFFSFFFFCCLTMCGLTGFKWMRLFRDLLCGLWYNHVTIGRNEVRWRVGHEHKCSHWKINLSHSMWNDLLLALTGNKPWVMIWLSVSVTARISLSVRQRWKENKLTNKIKNVAELWKRFSGYSQKNQKMLCWFVT